MNDEFEIEEELDEDGLDEGEEVADGGHAEDRGIELIPRSGRTGASKSYLVHRCRGNHEYVTCAM
jgi:hypothetical protein